MKADLSGVPSYPRSYKPCDIEFCKYIIAEHRITKFTACIYTQYMRKLKAEIGVKNLLSDRSEDAILREKYPNFDALSPATKTKYRKVIRYFREWKNETVKE